MLDVLIGQSSPYRKSTLSLLDNFVKFIRLISHIRLQRVAVKVLAASLILMLALTSNAQQLAPFSKKEAAIKRKVDQLSLRAPISVIRTDSEEEYGQFVSSDQHGFTFYDIDRKAEVTLKYAEVRKVKDGYGGYNSVHHRHTDRTKGLLVVLVVAGALGGLIAAAATAKN